MDFQALLNLAPVALLTFGSVWVVNYFLLRYTKVVLDTQGKLLLSIVFAFVYLFIPIEFQNLVVDKLKEAIAITLGITALYQAKKV